MPYKKLFQPGSIGGLQLKNRIIMAPMGSNIAQEDGSITDYLIDYYAERAAGGAGAIIIEATFPTMGRPGRLCLADDRFIPGFKRLTGAIKENGARAFVEIHAGRGRRDELYAQYAIEPVSCAELLIQGTSSIARALRTEEVEQRVAEFGDAALRARKSGFDGVEVHGAHGYLVADFLSPHLNKRTDKYGGTPENRARFATELIQCAKAKAGEDYVVMFRLSVDELGGHLPLPDAIVVCQMLEKAGADAIDIVTGGPDTYEWVALPYYVPLGYNTQFSEPIKKSISIPVSVAGRINDPYLADEILKQGKADFVTLGRALLADSEFPNKALQGRANDIRKCIACSLCAEMSKGVPLKCSINYAVGREKVELKPTIKPKKVLVLGGGPGGMEAARVAALRGHHVTLWEKAERLGGQVNLAALPPFKEELNGLILWFENQNIQAGVKVELNKEATLASIMEYQPDVVIVASGSRPSMLKLNGIATNRIVLAHDVLAGKVEVGEKVVVIGGGHVGCETADFLVSMGKQVSIVEVLETILSDAYSNIRVFFLPRLNQQNIEIFAGVKSEEITNDGLKIVDRDGRSTLLKADTIVSAVGSTPNNELFKVLQGKVPELYAIGDCVEPRKIENAIHEGSEIARHI